MSSKVAIFLVLVFCVPLGRVSGQQYNFTFDHIGVEDGLPARMVYHMEQDHDGFLWLSTQLGIHRYDGHQFKTYTNSSSGLPSRTPPYLAVDAENRLWISCPIPRLSKAQTIVLDLKQDRFLSVSEATNGQVSEEEIFTISSPHPSETGIMLLLKDGSLVRYDQTLENHGRFAEGFSHRLKAGKKGVFWTWGGGHIQVLHKGQIATQYFWQDYKNEHPTHYTILNGESIIWMARAQESWNCTVREGELHHMV